MSTQAIPESMAPSIAELERKLQSFVDQVALHLKADIVTLYLYDAERDKFYLPVGYGLKDQATFKYAMPRSDRIAGKIVKGRKPIIADDAKSHPDMSGPFTFRERVESAAGFPIFLGDRAVGVFFVDYRKPHTFTEEEIQTIENLLQYAVKILAASRVAEVRQILASLVPAMSVADKSLDFIIKSVCTFINAPVALWVLEPTTDTISVRASTGLRREFVESASIKLDEGNFVTEVIQSRDRVSISDIEEDGRFPFEEERQHEGWKSMLAVPVWGGGRVIGVLAIFTFTQRDFATWEQDLMIELAQRVGDVLMEEQHSQIVANLHEIGLALASRLELPQLLQLIVDKAAEVFGADIVTLYPYDQEYDEFAKPIALGVTNNFYEHPLPSKTGIAARIVQDGVPVFSDDAEQDPRMSKGFIVRQQVKSSAGFPLKVSDEVVGVLFINYRTPYNFLQSDQDLIALFASQAALAIKNARLFQEEQQRVTMAQIANTFSETLDRQRTLQAVVNGARQLTGATSSSLFLLNTETDAFELSARSPALTRPPRSLPRPEEGLTRAILNTGRPILIADASQDARVRPRVVREGTRSILGVPVQVKGERVGVLYVNSDLTDHFSQRDIGLLQSLADYGAIAIERTRPLEAITNVNEATANILRLDELIKELLGKIINELHFEFTALQLINREHNTIETVDGISAPWGAEAKHSLDSNDIQADIVRTRRTEIIAGPDPRFDRNICERFGHENLVRIFVPIIAEDTVLGTVEAGYDLRTKASISEEERFHLEALVAQYGPELREAMLPYVLKVIVDNAVRMVRADSGSIHVLFNAERGRYVYEACAGRIGPEFLEAFPPREQGIGHQSLEEGQPRWIDDPGELKETHRNIYAPKALWLEHPDKYERGEGVRAIACFPLVTGGKYEGVFYVHFWNKHTFSEDEVDWLKLFAHQVSVAIQNAQFYEKLRDRSQALTSLSMIGQSLVSELRLANLLTMIARGARGVLKADIVTIYRYDENRDFFITPPTIEGELFQPDFMQTPVDEEDAPWVIVHRLRKSCYAPDAKNEPIMCNRERERPASKGERFVDREGIESSAGILLTGRQEIVGVMFVNYRTHRDFTDSERRVIENFASYAAIAIRNARQVIQQRVDQLETIQVIDREISSTLDLDRVLDAIVDKSMEGLGVTDGFGTLQLFDEKSQELVMRAYKNLPPEKAGLRLHINDSGITPRVARTKEPALVPDTNQESNYVRLVPGIRSELAVPLVQDDRLIGVLNLESRTPQAFDEADVWFLTLLASEAVVAIQNARYVQQLEQLRRVLQTIASTRELQTVLAQIAESTITVLGADDAVIFPYSPEVGEFIPDKLVHRGQARTHFQPGVPREGGIAYTVLEQGLVAVNDVTSAPPELNIVPGTGLLGEIGAQAFVGVTLRVREDGRDKVLGVLYVDHRRPHRFSDTELDLIRTFADQAAIAINNARQETQRRRAERVAAMHTFGGNFIHKVVSRLGTIPAYFEEVKEALERDDKKTLDLWLPYLAMDVQKVEQIMQAAERLKTFQRGERHPLQINQIIQEVISTFDVPENIHLVTDLDPNLPDLTANRLSIEDLLANLIDNAIKAMPHGGKLSLISQGAKDQRWILVKVEDTGAGMSQTVLSRIFEPFYGVRPDGLGLGLWLVQRAVQEMGGEIHVASELGQGTVFTIRLPVEQRSNDERTTSESTSR